MATSADPFVACFAAACEIARAFAPDSPKQRRDKAYRVAARELTAGVRGRALRWRDVAVSVAPIVSRLSYEVAIVAMQCGRTVVVEEVARGSATEVMIPVGRIVHAAEERRASAIVLAHNHPGDEGPSAVDRRMTRAMLRDLPACVERFEHVVISNNGYAFSILSHRKIDLRLM